VGVVVLGSYSSDSVHDALVGVGMGSSLHTQEHSEGLEGSCDGSKGVWSPGILLLPPPLPPIPPLRMEAVV